MLTGLKDFLAINRFPLTVAGLWLALVWGGVILAQMYHQQSVSLGAWAVMWDGGWYQSIIEHGYYNAPPSGQVNVAFFPLLPIIVGALSTITTLPVAWAGMLVSSGCFVAALVLLYKLVAQQFSPAVAKWTLLLLACNPFSFYFGMLYTESLFLLLAVLVFWWLLQKQWWLAASAAGLASATRSVGVALGAAVITTWLVCSYRTVFRPQNLLQFIGICLLSVSGLVAFTLYMWLHTGDPLAYMHAQQFWPGRSGGSNIGVELIYLIRAKDINAAYVITLMWYAFLAVGLVGIWLLARMRQWSMVLFAVIALALPVIFGTATAVNRYLQVVFPIFIAYAVLLQRQHRYIKSVVIAGGIVSLGVALFLLLDPRHPFLG